MSVCDIVALEHFLFLCVGTMAEVVRLKFVDYRFENNNNNNQNNNSSKLIKITCGTA